MKTIPAMMGLKPFPGHPETAIKGEGKSPFLYSQFAMAR